MDIGLGIPQVGPFADPDMARSVAIAAEATGYSSVWALDRLIAPVAQRSRRSTHPSNGFQSDQSIPAAAPDAADRPSIYPHGSFPNGPSPREDETSLDPIVTLAVAAAVTERIRIGTNVLVAPLYSPMLLARSIASLDQASNGRLTVGLGLGSSTDEYRAVGAPVQHLGARMEEILEVLTAAWSNDVVDIETSRELVVPSIIGPKPVQSPRPPILLAAYTPAGLEQIARRADGWTPAGMPIGYIGPMWASVLEKAERYGRDPESLRLVIRANVKRTATAMHDVRPPFHGSLHQLRNDLEEYRELGAHEVILDLQGTTSSVDELLDLAADLAYAVPALV